MPINMVYGYFRILGSAPLVHFVPSTTAGPPIIKIHQNKPPFQKKYHIRSLPTKLTKFTPLYPKYTKTSPFPIKSITKDPFLQGWGAELVQIEETEGGRGWTLDSYSSK